LGHKKVKRPGPIAIGRPATASGFHPHFDCGYDESEANSYTL